MSVSVASSMLVKVYPGIAATVPRAFKSFPGHGGETNGRRKILLSIAITLDGVGMKSITLKKN